VLSAGEIEQVGTPLELYNDPNNVFVAKFIGSPAMNVVPAIMKNSGEHSVISTGTGVDFSVAIDSATVKDSEQLQLGVRPEDLELATANDGLLEGTVLFVESLGEVTLVHLENAGQSDTIVAKLPGIVALEKGQHIYLKTSADKLHLFNSAGLSLKRV